MLDFPCAKDSRPDLLPKNLDTFKISTMKSMMNELVASAFQEETENSEEKKPEEEAVRSVRSSSRRIESAYRFREIFVKKHFNYMQIMIVSNEATKNSLTLEALKELKVAFSFALKDANCKAVLLSSSGSYFSSGVDISQLIGRNKKRVIEGMALAIKELVLTLSSFKKPLISAVNGIAVGFAVTLLTFSDVVLASDKATFAVPATSLGYVPEGAITYTLPQVVGSRMANEMLLQCRKITADQALNFGLVTEVLWHPEFMSEVQPHLQRVLKHDPTAMQATKIMVRCMLWENLAPHLDREASILPAQWLNPKCQASIKKALESGWLLE